MLAALPCQRLVLRQRAWQDHQQIFRNGSQNGSRTALTGLVWASGRVALLCSVDCLATWNVRWSKPSKPVTTRSLSPRLFRAKCRDGNPLLYFGSDYRWISDVDSMINCSVTREVYTLRLDHRLMPSTAASV